MRLSLRRSRRTITVVAAALLAAFGLAVAGGAAAVPAAAATSSCAAAYSVPTDWGSGFTANLTITDNGTAAITGWTVTYTYAGNQTLANGWNGGLDPVRQDGHRHQRVLQRQPRRRRLHLSRGQLQLLRRQRRAHLGHLHPRRVHHPAARRLDHRDPGQPERDPGQSGTFTLALSQAPASNVTVSVAASGNTGLTASPASLTFTPVNYSTAQTVTVTANASGTGATTFTASGGGYTSADRHRHRGRAGDGLRSAVARVGQQAGRRQRQHGRAAWRGPLRHRVRVRSGQRHLRRPE